MLLPPAFCMVCLKRKVWPNAVTWVRRAMEKGYSYARFITPNAFAYQSEDNGRTVNLEAIEHLLREMAGLMAKDKVYFGTFPSEVGPETVTPEVVLTALE